MTILFLNSWFTRALRGKKQRKEGMITKRALSPAFLWLWLGGTLSYTADLMLFTLLALWVATSVARTFSWVVLATNGVSLAAALPIIVLGPVAGGYIDRWSKRRVMLVGDACRAACIAGLALLASQRAALAPLPILCTIYALVVLASCCGQFFNPARFVLTSYIVEDMHRGQATALSQTTNNLILLVGPIGAPLLFVWAGPVWALALTALLYACSFTTIWFIHCQEPSPAPREQTHFIDELRAGVRFVIFQPMLRVLVITSGLQLLGAGAIDALNLFFLLRVLHAPLALYGLTSTTTAIGALLGSSFSLALLKRFNLVRLYQIGLLATSLGLLLYSRQTLFPVAVVLTGIFGVFQGIVAVPQGPLIMHVTPQALLGRVNAILSPFQALCLALGTMLAGSLSTLWGTRIIQAGPLRFGPIDSVLTLGAFVALAGAVYAFFHLKGEPPEDRLPGISAWLPEENGAGTPTAEEPY